MLLYLVLFLLAFGSMWAFTIYTGTVTIDYGLHADACKQDHLPSIREEIGVPNRPACAHNSPKQRQMMPNKQ